MFSSEQKKKEELEATNASIGRELHTSIGRLQSLEGFLVEHSEIDEKSVTTSFSNLWAFAASEVFPFLEQEVAAKILNEKLRTTNFRNLPHYVPLVPSNTPGAKGMRFAMTLAVLSREIDRHIFRPMYILPGDAQIRDILSHLAERNSEKEAFCRRVLLSIDPDAENEITQSEIRAVVRSMSSYVWGLLSETQHDSFCTSIERIVQNAVEVCIPIQHAQQKYETDFELSDLEDDEWRHFNFPNDYTAQNE
ncbi:hypothetical protein N7474_005056 [Penicillium riverlandense]|uniref:uncharacterized protein n=1 Tax=Penicillium riverlandense TaxID=1903569 RepID=UPI002549502D|nr:uncharacterized protein N7474_005056 [Penicillium riverlandense]KAJ5819465.1 hypothetical protein N7474_005056 [Penicillium riverlandense]